MNLKLKYISESVVIRFIHKQWNGSMDKNKLYGKYKWIECHQSSFLLHIFILCTVIYGIGYCLLYLYKKFSLFPSVHSARRPPVPELLTQLVSY